MNKERVLWHVWVASRATFVPASNEAQPHPVNAEPKPLETVNNASPNNRSHIITPPERDTGAPARLPLHHATASQHTTPHGHIRASVRACPRATVNKNNHKSRVEGTFALYLKQGMHASAANATVRLIYYLGGQTNGGPTEPKQKLNRYMRLGPGWMDWMRRPSRWVAGSLLQFLHAMTLSGSQCRGNTTMEDDDANSSETPSPTSTSTSRSEYAGSVIRCACKSDTEAIVEVEATSFPQVYHDAASLVDSRRRELEGGYPCYKILAASSEFSKQSAVHGFVIFESYLRSFREYRDSKTGEGIALPANRPQDTKPAYSILMAAIRVDPELLEEEFLFSDAAQQWTTDEAEEVDAVELTALREREQRTTMPFYEDKLGFKKRAYFFWGRRGSAIPRIFHVMQYPAHE
ncbi:hypothetical protein CHU98_g10313 [Xylaria longipes]|nr:hypothetical protein CHU98_g10313 [Xylaria longipes]